MTSVKIRKIGNALGIIFPKEVLAELNSQEGDELHIRRTEQGFELTLNDSDFSAEMEAYRHTAQQHRGALRELSK